MAAADAIGAEAVELRAGWIRSPGWDALWMFSALWGALLLAASGLFDSAERVGQLFVVAGVGVSIAHSWSTTYMVLLSPLLAEERRRRPRKYLWTPLVLVGLAFALGLAVASWQRFPADGRFGPGLWPFALYISLFWVGHFWHFGNQDFGVLTLYRQKAGQSGGLDRRVDKLYTVAMMFVIQPVVYLSIVRTTAFSELAYTLLPIDLPTLRAVAELCVVAAGLLSLGVAGYELSKPNRSLPKLLYIGVIFLHPTLLYASLHWAPAFGAAYFVAYLWSHWLIAIGLVARINTGFYRSHGASPWLAAARHGAWVGGITTFVLLLTAGYQRFALFNVDGFRYKEILAGITPEARLVIGLFFGFFLAEQLLHYYCDRCLFRFRDAGVRKRVAPLLLG